MNWECAHTLVTTASAATVWQRWTSPQCWPDDDVSLSEARFRAKPVVGDRGFVRGPGGEQDFVFIELDPERSMTLEFDLPGTTLRLLHTLAEIDEGLQVTHCIRLEGPLAGAIGATVGRRLARDLPQIVENVADNSL